MTVRRRLRRTSVSTTLLVAAALPLAACGSTVQTTATGQLSSTGANGLGGPVAAATDGLTGTGPATSSAPAAANGPSAGLSRPGALGGRSAPLATAGPTEAGRTYRDSSGVVQGIGVTATSINIGMGFLTNGDAANAALGADKITQGDTKGETQAVINDINAHGGLAGRKLVPIWHGWDQTSADSKAAQDQSACADYTQDHKVFSVIDIGGDTFQACLKKAGILQLYSGDIISSDAEYFREFPHFMDLGTMSMDRAMADEVPSLVRQGYFTGWDATVGGPATTKAKVGILSINDPSWNRPLEKVMLPALARAGQKVDPNDIYRVNPGNSTADDGAIVADIQSAALRFRNDGVTHVIFLDATGSLTLFFSQNAKGQHYYPRYGANSGTGMQALYDAGTIDAAQLKGAVGIGWQPSLDLPAAEGNKYGTPATKHCLAVMSKNGFTFDSTNAASIALSICDTLYFLQEVIGAAGKSITLDTVQAAVDATGSRFVPAALPAAYLSATRHDAAALAFDMKWDSGCSCVKYADNGHLAE